MTNVILLLLFSAISLLYIPLNKLIHLFDQSMYATIINWLYAHDRDGNGFPSGHVFHTLVGSFYLLQVYPA